MPSICYCVWAPALATTLSCLQIFDGNNELRAGLLLMLWDLLWGNTPLLILLLANLHDHACTQMFKTNFRKNSTVCELSPSYVQIHENTEAIIMCLILTGGGKQQGHLLAGACSSPLHTLERPVSRGHCRKRGFARRQSHHAPFGIAQQGYIYAQHRALYSKSQGKV